MTKLVDGIILVVRAGATPRETVQQAINLIGKEKLLGVILNQVEFKSSGLFKKYFGSNGYYHSYGYGYGYGYGRKNEKGER
jgi:Mrp family chromosome partitioning ATPase